MRHHLGPAAWRLGLGLGMGLLGCPDRITGAVDCSDPASAGQGGCPCFSNGGCREGLGCISNVCMPPGISTLSDTGNASDGASTGDGATTGGGCTPGTKGCGCVEGTCGIGLICTDDTCELDSGSTETTGEASADATAGDEGVCAEPHVDLCYVDGELRDCCSPDHYCWGSPDVYYACEPPCRSHAECPDCCLEDEVDDVLIGKFCSPSSVWCGVLCINTCGAKAQDGSFAGNGQCQDLDGWRGCEYGTDCADCGPQEPKELAQRGDVDAVRVVAHEYRRGEHEVRVLFDQPVELSSTAGLITIFDDQGDEVAVRLRQSRIHAFKGVPIPAGHVVIATWKSRADAPARDMQLHVSQDGAPDDYRATLRAQPRR